MSEDHQSLDRTRFRECGTDVVIEPGVFIEHPENVRIGNRVRIRRGVTIIGSQKEIWIGSDVSLYPNIFIQGRGRLVIHDKVTLYPNNYLSIGSEEGWIEIGSHSHFAPGCALYGAHGLRIGEYCAIAAHSVLATVGHDPQTKFPELLATTSSGAPITLVRDIWLGANSTITPGVTISEGCIVGAGAVVTKNTDPYGIYLGVPAKRTGTRAGK